MLSRLRRAYARLSRTRPPYSPLASEAPTMTNSRSTMIARRRQLLEAEAAHPAARAAELEPLRASESADKAAWTRSASALAVAAGQMDAHRRALGHERESIERALQEPTSVPHALRSFLDELVGRHTALMQRPTRTPEEILKEPSPHLGWNWTTSTHFPGDDLRTPALAALAEVRAAAETLIFTAVGGTDLGRTLAEFRQRLDAAGVPEPVPVWRAPAVAR